MRNVYLSPPKPRSSSAPPRSCWPRSTLKIKRKRDAEATTVATSGSPVGTWQVFTSSQQSRKVSLTEKEMSQGREGNLSSGPWLCNHWEFTGPCGILRGGEDLKASLTLSAFFPREGEFPATHLCTCTFHRTTDTSIMEYRAYFQLFSLKLGMNILYQSARKIELSTFGHPLPSELWLAGVKNSTESSASYNPTPNPDHPNSHSSLGNLIQMLNVKTQHRSLYSQMPVVSGETGTRRKSKSASRTIHSEWACSSLGSIFKSSKCVLERSE